MNSPADSGDEPNSGPDTDPALETDPDSEPAPDSGPDTDLELESKSDHDAGPLVAVLRLGHRPGRDERMTTHVGLTARALGADRVYLPARAAGAGETIEDVTERFGGPFDVAVTESPKSVIRDWEGLVVHLTMYGERVQDVEDEIRSASVAESVPLLLVVGAEKVSFDVFEAADWNVAVTNQPHSEVASLAVFLDRLFDGRELEREWENRERRVIPQEAGKRVETIESDDESAPTAVDGE